MYQERKVTTISSRVSASAETNDAAEMFMYELLHDHEAHPFPHGTGHN